MQSKFSLFPRLKRIRLAGGPTLICLPELSAPTVSMQIWLPAGSSSEKKGEDGLAHFLEHMIFKGSRNLGVGELASRVEGAGGDINAYTMSDAAYYYLTCLPEFAETCLESLADAVWWPRLNSIEMDRERGVILAEIDRSMDQPDQVLQHHLFQRAYGKSHPYGQSIMGSRRSVSRFAGGDLRRFHRRRYDPSVSVVVISGNMQVRGARRVLREKFRAESGKGSRRPAKMRPAAIPAPAPSASAPRLFALRGRSGLAHLEIAFSIPTFRHPDAPALDILAMILGMGESSRLFQKLCVETSLMHEVSAENFFSLGDGLLFLGGLAEPGAAVDSIENILRTGIGIAGEFPPTAEEMNRARLNFISDLEFRRESMGGYARMAGYAQLLAGGVRFSERYLNRLLQVSPDDVRRAAARYLRPEGITSGCLIPRQSGGRLDARKMRGAVLRGFADRGGAAKKRNSGGPADSGGAFPKIKFAAPKKGVRIRKKVFEYSLPGGARLIALPGGRARVFAIRAVALGGQRLEGEKCPGLHNLMSGVVAQATRSMDSAELAERIEGLGAALEGFSGRNTVGLSASSLSLAADEVMEIFAAVLTEPAFSASDLSQALREIDAERRGDMDDLGNLSRLRGMALLYGAHPFGRHPLGHSRPLSRVEPRALHRAWRRWMAPRNLVLGVAGDIDPGEVRRKLGRLLKKWADRSPSSRLPRPPDRPVPPVRGRRQRYTVEGATQGHIQLSYLGADFHDSRRYALSVLTTALGSQGGGLFWELREKRGLAYAVYASSEEALDPGPVSFYAATAPEAEEEALEILCREIERVRKTGLGDDELERAKAFLAGEQLRTLQRAGARASDLAFDALFGLKRESPEEYRKKMEAVSARDVLEAARHFLAPGKDALVRIGPPLKRRGGRRQSTK
ncbi:MAG: pitrilysin family protein [Nitrospinota bacterium]